jgi:hypothetical protein
MIIHLEGLIYFVKDTETEIRGFLIRKDPIIAHEVRNPLTNNNLSLDQIKLSAGQGNEKSVALMLDMQSRNSSRINLLIN